MYLIVFAARVFLHLECVFTFLCRRLQLYEQQH